MKCKNRNFSIYFLCLILLTFICSKTYAEPAQVILTTGDNYSPYTGSELPQGGMITEIISSILQEMDLAPTYLRLPWKRAILTAEMQEAIGSFPWETRPDLEKTFLYSQPIITIDTKVFIDEKSIKKFNFIADLEGQTLCLPLGYKVYDVIGAMVESGKLETISPTTMEKCFKLLKLGRANLISTSGTVAKQYAKQVYGYDDGVQALNFASSRITLHLLVSKHYENASQFLNRFDIILKRRQTQNTIAPIIERHLWVP